MFTRVATILLAVSSIALSGCGDDGATPPATDGGMPSERDCGPALVRDGGVSACPAPPACATGEARAAIDVENAYRVGMGIPCATMVESINEAASNHCVYHVNATGSCVSMDGPHVEVRGCPDYTGVEFWHRMEATGYPGTAIWEGMAFLGDGHAAMEQLVHSVWHRTPILSPWIRDMGYGASGACDTVDFGRGRATPDGVVATFPYDLQTGVPTSFDGSMEGPEPPEPPVVDGGVSGWPSGYPVHIFAKGAIVATHTLTVDGDMTPIPHLWIVPDGPDDPNHFLGDAHVLYAEEPLMAATTYRVKVIGTYTGGDLDLDFTFTTQ